MEIAVIGLGYVGLVTAACFADLGNEVVCLDNDRARIRQLKLGKMPFYEPGLKELVIENHRAGRLLFTNKINKAVRNAKVIFIAVGTPPKSSGEADLTAQVKVAHQIATMIKNAAASQNNWRIIVNKSTVPVGMGDIIGQILENNCISRQAFEVVSNPEFLREGTAINDFMAPDRIVIGTGSNRAVNLLTELYRPLNAHIIFTSLKSAELIKYASNAYLASRISFINEIANICERLGSDITEVINGMGLDKRIGISYLSPGIGYGGSCLPKDVSALIHLATSQGYDPRLLMAVRDINEDQKTTLLSKILKLIKNPRGKSLAVLGLSFKPGTDDLREAPALAIIKLLRQQGFKVKIFDPVSVNLAKKLLGTKNIVYCRSVDQAIRGVEGLVVVTEWNEFRELNLKRVKDLMNRPILVDCRNIYNPKKVKELGFNYVSIGR